MIAFLWAYFHFKRQRGTLLCWFAWDFPASQTKSPASWGPSQSQAHGGQPVILDQLWWKLLLVVGQLYGFTESLWASCLTTVTRTRVKIMLAS